MRRARRTTVRILVATPPIIVTKGFAGRNVVCALKEWGEEAGHSGSSSRQDCFHLEEQERERETLPVIDLAKSPYGAAARFTKINLFSLLYLRGRNILAAAANACLCARIRQFRPPPRNID